MPSPLILKAAYLLTTEQLITNQGQQALHREAITALERAAVTLKKIRDELQDGVCRSCNGYGEIREWYAQDESKVLKCAVCNGTGVP